MTEELIGKYRVLRGIGAGGMATVFLASHVDVPNLKTVLKKLTDRQLVGRFKSEANKLALLDGHSGICQIKHFFEHEDDFYIVMEFIDGPNLDELVKSDNPPDIDRSVEIARSILDTLDFAHRQEIVHRDIKPSNIMLDRRGQVKIIDFGIAKGAADPDLTQAGTSLGSPRYMAPEQFNPQGPLDWVRCDLYAVGVTLYYLLAGQLPFKGSNVYEIAAFKQREDVPPPSRLNPEITPKLDSVVLKSMSRDPAVRFATVAEMRDALSDLDGPALAAPVPQPATGDHTMVLGDGVPLPGMETMTPTPTPTPAPTPAPVPPSQPGWADRYVNRRNLYLAGAAAVVVILGIIGIITLGPGDPPIPDKPPVLVTPVSGAALDVGRIDFRWQSSGDSLGVFTLQYDLAEKFSSASRTTEHRGFRFSLTDSLPAGSYVWRVKQGPLDSADGLWSRVDTFTIKSAPVAREEPKADPPKTRTDQPAKKPDPKPVKQVIKREVRIGARQDGVNMLRFDAEVYIDGKLWTSELPYTIELTIGDHQVKAVYESGGEKRTKHQTIKVTEDGKSAFFIEFGSTD